MGFIKQLPEDIAMKIAAGEVVERPASVIKELVENALDAGATKIEVSLAEGGKALIEVKDNGSGMDRDDAVACFLRHGTSKISQVDDLLHVTTLGFRGEALAAIGASGEVTITTTLQGSSEGTLVQMRHGELAPAKPHAPLAGTTVRVEQLFSALPARQKFLKAEATEWKASLETLIKQMASHPEVGFLIKHNERVIYDLPSQSFSERVAALWKVESEVLVPVAVESPHMTLTGVIAKPHIAHDGKARQFFAVNGHPVNDKMIARAIKDAFGTLLPPAMYPSYALNLSIHPGMVDVNIHPRKDEVRFVNSQDVFRFVSQAASQSLDGVNAAFTSFSPTPFAATRPAFQASPFEPADYASREPISLPLRASSPGRVPTLATPLFQAMRPSPDSLSFALPQPTSTAPVLVIDNCFLITQHDGKLLLIDQHAAHERILYNQFWQQENAKSLVRQSLLLPAQLSLAPDEAALFASYRNDFEALGFAFTDDSDLYILEVPQAMKLADPVGYFKRVFAGLHEGRNEPELTDMKHKLFATMACKAAVKAGDVLSDIEQQRLIADLLKAESFTCPHGRPSHIEVSAGELEKLFKRTGF